MHPHLSLSTQALQPTCVLCPLHELNLPVEIGESGQKQYSLRLQAPAYSAADDAHHWALQIFTAVWLVELLVFVLLLPSARYGMTGR